MISSRLETGQQSRGLVPSLEPPKQYIRVLARCRRWHLRELPQNLWTFQVRPSGVSFSGGLIHMTPSTTPTTRFLSLLSIIVRDSHPQIPPWTCPWRKVITYLGILGYRLKLNACMWTSPLFLIASLLLIKIIHYHFLKMQSKEKLPRLVFQWGGKNKHQCSVTILAESFQRAACACLSGRGCAGEAHRGRGWGALHAARPSLTDYSPYGAHGGWGGSPYSPHQSAASQAHFSERYESLLLLLQAFAVLPLSSFCFPGPYLFNKVFHISHAFLPTKGREYPCQKWPVMANPFRLPTGSSYD